MNFKTFKIFERDITVFRKKIWDYDLDFRFSYEFEYLSLDKWTSLEDFVKNNEYNFKISWKSIYVFCFNNYEWLNDLIQDLIKKWNKDIETAEIFIYQENNFLKL